MAVVRAISSPNIFPARALKAFATFCIEYRVCSSRDQQFWGFSYEKGFQSVGWFTWPQASRYILWCAKVWHNSTAHKTWHTSTFW